MNEILYRSRRLEVRSVAAGDGRRRVVTFDSYHEPAGIDRPGFGQSFFETEGIAAIHVLSHGNDWFQYPELKGVLELIRAHCAPSGRVLSYGSSMGGYAALRFARAIGAHAALALSPQYSLDRRKVPFETRWAQDQRRIRFLRPLDGPLAPAPDMAASGMIVAYDPALNQDCRHAELFARDVGLTLLPLPYAGHPVGGFLAECRLLRPLVLTALDGSLKPDRFLRAAHRRRTSSPHWLANLAEHQPAWRKDCSVALARRAVTLAPNHVSLLDILARRLAAAGQYDEAIAVHAQAIAIEPIVDYLWGLTKTLFAAGDLPGALEIARRLQQLAPRTAGYHAWAAKIRETQGDLPGTLADLRIALKLDRTNRAYRFMVRKLGWQLRLARWSRTLLGS